MASYRTALVLEIILDDALIVPAPTGPALAERQEALAHATFSLCDLARSVHRAYYEGLERARGNGASTI